MSNINNLLTHWQWESLGDRLWAAPDGRRFWAAEETVPRAWARSATAYLAKALLDARARSELGVTPLSALVVQRATPLINERLERFVAEVAPGASWILLDVEGRAYPHVAGHDFGRGLEERPRAKPLRPTPPASLFTDLNQWMLKVLFAPRLPAKLLTAPRDLPLRNATTLAKAARVSLAAANRFLAQLDDEGHLDKRYEVLRLSEPEALFQRWKTQAHPAKVDTGVVLTKGTLESVLARARKLTPVGTPSLTLAVHAACETLGFGYVTGPVLKTVCIPPKSQLVPAELGLVVDPRATRLDVVLRTPRFPQSLFRGAVLHEGVPCTDVIQCWLDASQHRVRGPEQANFIWRTVLQPALAA